MGDASLFNITFRMGSGDGTVVTAMISAVDDTAVEGDHDFTVSIESTTNPLATVGISSVTATIIDNDRKSNLRYKRYFYNVFFLHSFLTLQLVVFLFKWKRQLCLWMKMLQVGQ